MVAAASLMAALLPVAVFACSCVEPSPPAESLSMATAVFSGTVLAIKDSGRYERNVRFEVDGVWKGDVGREATVTTASESTACGYDFAVGTRYLVYAHGSGGLETNICSRTAAFPAAAGDVAGLGVPRELVATPDVRERPVMVLLLGALGLAVGLGLARRRAADGAAEG